MRTSPICLRRVGRPFLAAAFLLGSVLGASALTPALAATSPALRSVTYAGNAATSQGTGVGIDKAGNVYVSGTMGEGSSARAFVAKYDPTGAHLLYTTYISAPCGAYGNALAVDATGNAYLTGQYGAKNQFGICQEITDVLAVKLDPAGHIVYQKALGPTSQDEVLTQDYNQGEAIAVDASGNVYITGLADGDIWIRTFPISPNALQQMARARWLCAQARSDGQCRLWHVPGRQRDH